MGFIVLYVMLLRILQGTLIPLGFKYYFKASGTFEILSVLLLIGYLIVNTYFIECKNRSKRELWE